MKIDPIHITEAEQIFINGNTFDEAERIKFINYNETCDLLAVPGSGKTTVLLAKLYAMSKQLPFNNGSGILVLSHTNAAVDEIESKLKTNCPKLFEYPNFVGTVQGFVNKFLASPANCLKYGSYITKNDNDIYLNEVKRFYYSLQWSQNNSAVKNLKNVLYGKANTNKGNISTNEKNDNTISLIYHLKFDFENRKLMYGDKNTTLYKFGGSANHHYLELESWKENLLMNGMLNYSDSFYLAKWAMNNYPKIKEQIQNRFKYVFIDEMQDLEETQIELIDSIFAKGEGKTVIQRIGDINQAIYNSGKKVKIECDWKTRNEYYLTGSNRLTKQVSELVNSFTLDSKNGKFIVDGKKVLPNGDIPPHLILFTDATKNKLKDKFEQLVYDYKLVDTDEAKYGYKIIGWTGERENEADGKLCLHSIFGFTKELKTFKEDYNTLSKYLQLFDSEKKTLEAVRKSILNAFINILRLEGKKLEKTVRGKKFDRYYTKSDLIEFIKAYNQEGDYLNACEGFKGKLFIWCFELVTQKNHQTIYAEIVVFINAELKTWFDLSLSSAEIIEFVGTRFTEVRSGLTKVETVIASDDKPNIEIETVHSVKGQTHCATMYVETSYFTYETKKPKIIDALTKQSHGFVIGQKKGKTEVDARGKEALKMMYVGFSRPTHLLCFAALNDNIGDTTTFESAGWKIDKSLC